MTILEALETIQTMKIRDKTPISCTSDKCKNATQPHKYIGERIEAGINYGTGWYQCLNCGTFRQDIRHQGKPSSPSSE